MTEVSAAAGSKYPAIGEAGRNVIANIEQLRRARGLSFRDLSECLAAAGRPIVPTVLHRLSQGNRRVDADDLVAFAAVLGVSPEDLLQPGATVRADAHPALREGRSLVARIADVLAAPGDAVAAGRLKRAMKRARIEVAELLEDEKGGQ
jgi:hypothetical protein